MASECGKVGEERKGVARVDRLRGQGRKDVPTKVGIRLFLLFVR